MTIDVIGNLPGTAGFEADGRHACLDFVNSEFTDWLGSGSLVDRINSPEWWRPFLKRWGLAHGVPIPPNRRVVADLRSLRGLMRKVLDERRIPSASEVSELNRRLSRTPHVLKVNTSGGRIGYSLDPSHEGWGSVTTGLIASFANLLARFEPSRLKQCANPDCSYLFYDRSTNRSRRWCFSGVCGNLTHVRMFRVRRRSDATKQLRSSRRVSRA
jgi:predicted RNA-binding Zn ribbon-like protein